MPITYAGGYLYTYKQKYPTKYAYRTDIDGTPREMNGSKRSHTDHPV